MKDSIKQAKIIIDSISAMIQSSLSKAKFNTKKRATIQALNGDGTANITMNGITYNDIKICTGLLPQVNEVVWIEIPNNNFNDAFIDTANNISGGSGGEIDPNSHTHINKELLDSYTQTEVNLADSVSKKHEHNNFTLLQSITQALIDTWNTVTNKVDKITGKGLSTNDFDNFYKTKLEGIESEAQTNVNADWNATTGDALIFNKPTIPSFTSELTNNSSFVSDVNYVHTDNNYTTTEKTKLAGVATNANNYTHPVNHPPSVISQDANNRFVTDTEKSTWNAKANNSVATNSANGLMSLIDKIKLDEIQVGTYGDIDGGSAVSTYTLNQSVNGGNANG